jgi:hypothetical protein
MPGLGCLNGRLLRPPPSVLASATIVRAPSDLAALSASVRASWLLSPVSPYLTRIDNGVDAHAAAVEARRQFPKRLALLAARKERAAEAEREATVALAKRVAGDPLAIRSLEATVCRGLKRLRAWERGEPFEPRLVRPKNVVGACFETLDCDTTDCVVEAFLDAHVFKNADATQAAQAVATLRSTSRAFRDAVDRAGGARLARVVADSEQFVSHGTVLGSVAVAMASGRLGSLSYEHFSCSIPLLWQLRHVPPDELLRAYVRARCRVAAGGPAVASRGMHSRDAHLKILELRASRPTEHTLRSRLATVFACASPR